MTTITLEDIKAEHQKILGMITKLEAQTRIVNDFPITIPFPNLNAGEKWAGFILSADGSKRHHLILLPGEREEINWQDAMDWAAEIGGELPDRTESALLFATMKDEFSGGWHWTREQHAANSDYAWSQNFTLGDQDGSLKSYELRARAVRRLEI